VYGSVVVVVLEGTSYELSTNFKVNSGIYGLGMDTGSVGVSLGHGVGVSEGVGVGVGAGVGEGLF
jgi:hypothetical protein